jgi:thiopurine S-methyltransferase
MERDFWEQAWREGRTRFHKDKPHGHLVEFGHLIKNDYQVFVPLAGKTLDMLYLRDQGHHVLAVELSSIAIESFIKENKLSLKKTKLDSHTLYSMPGLDIYHGDFFELPKEALENIEAIYDRAALIALPPEMRKQYAQFIQGNMPKLKDILLLALEYDQSKADGPPFSVEEKEIVDLYSKNFKIQPLLREKTEDFNPKFEGKGIDQFWHTGFHLKHL